MTRSFLVSVNWGKGQILTPANVSIGTANDTKQIPSGAMWLTKPEEAYGFRIHQARKKGEAITGYDLLKSTNSDLAIKPAEPLWSQYAKSSIVCDKKHDFALSNKYEEGALTELEKLAKRNQHLTYMDDASLIFDMLNHSERNKTDFTRTIEWSKKKQSELSSPLVFFKLGQLKSEQNKMKNEELQKANDKAARDKRLYSIFSSVLPPKCQVVQFLAKDVQEDTQDLKKVSLSPELEKASLEKARTARTAFRAEMAKWELPKSNFDRANDCNALGQIQLKSGDYKSATNHFIEALKLDPSYAAAYAGTAYAKAKLRDYQAAISDFNQAIKLYPSSPLIYFNRGVSLCYSRDYKSAIADFSHVVILDPKDALAYFYRGLARDHIRDKGSSDDFERVTKMFVNAVPLGGPRLELDPDQIYDYYTRSYKRRLLSETNTTGEDRLLKSDPKAAAPYVTKARDLLTHHDYQGALNACNKALQLDPSRQEAYDIRMQAHWGLRDTKSAHDDIKESRKLMNSQQKYLQVTSKALDAGTIDDYNQWLKLKPNETFAYYGRGYDRMHLGDYKGAIEDFTLALKYNPNYAHAYQCRGDAREKLGDTKGASDDHSQAAMREPVYAMGAAMKALTASKSELPLKQYESPHSPQ